MKPYYLLILFLLMATSCQFFETEKISTETFYNEELKTIDWSEVDQYPLFEACENLSEKENQKNCFIGTLSTFLYEAANNSISSTHLSLDSTVFIEFSISEKAELKVAAIEMDSTVSATFPRLNAALRARIDSMKLVAPAYKRGIPVRTEFTLPIDIVTEDL
jgi:hypothetical protein